MKKQSFLLLLFVAFGSLVCAQIPAPEPNSTLKQKLNPNTDPQNQQTPAQTSASTPAPKSDAPKSTAGGKSGTSGRTTTPPQQRPATVPASAPPQSASAAKEEPSPAQPQPAGGFEKQPTESPAAAAKRKLIADGYMVCMTHPEYGKVYCNEAQTKGKKGKLTTYFYIDEDGIAVPIVASALSDKATAPQVADQKVPINNKPAPLPKADRPVNRWVSPFLGDWLTIQPGFISDLTLINTGYKNKTLQYYAYQWLPKADYPNATAVYSWNMPKCPNCFILLAEHEFSDEQLTSWGYSNKVFQFFALKDRPAEGNFMAVSRWINALPAGNGCRDFTLSVTEKEFTDAQLVSWGYTNKIVQFYVPTF